MVSKRVVGIKNPTLDNLAAVTSIARHVHIIMMQMVKRMKNVLILRNKQYWDNLVLIYFRTGRILNLNLPVTKRRTPILTHL